MTKNEKTFRLGRRGVLGGAAAATGGLLLKSLATGIPAKILLDPLSATAEQMPGQASVCIIASSRNGDPLNANVPGTYGFADLYHSADPNMVETPLSLGGVSTSAAKPWADLGPSVLDRTCFFHHANLHAGSWRDGARAADDGRD